MGGLFCCEIASELSALILPTIRFLERLVQKLIEWFY